MEERAHRGRLHVWSFLWLDKIVCSVFNSDWRHILGIAVVSCPNFLFQQIIPSSLPSSSIGINWVCGCTARCLYQFPERTAPPLPASPSLPLHQLFTPYGPSIIDDASAPCPPQGARRPCAPLRSGVQCRIWWGAGTAAPRLLGHLSLPAAREDTWH